MEAAQKPFRGPWIIAACFLTFGLSTGFPYYNIAFFFDTAGQQDVLTPFLEQFLEVADTFWEDKGVQIASTALEYMFPRALTSRQTLDRVDAWLAESEANPAAKRFVAEARADIARALAAQQADA